MNALTIGSLIAFLVIIGGGGYWLYRRGRFEGASQQNEENEEEINEYLAGKAPDMYSGNVGSHALRVRRPGAWSKDTPASSGVRVEPGKGDGGKQRKKGGEVHDR